METPILYTQAGCLESSRVRAWLDKQGVAFIERNVTGDPAAARDLLATGTFATPLLVVGDRQALGYRPAALAEALRASRADAPQQAGAQRAG